MPVSVSVGPAVSMCAEPPGARRPGRTVTASRTRKTRRAPPPRSCRRRTPPAVIPPVAGAGRVLAHLVGEGFPGAGKTVAPILDYDLRFIPVVTVISPLRIGMCVLLSRFAPWAYGRGRRSPETEAVDVAPAEPGTLLPGGTNHPAPTPWGEQ